jgi:hypothetical protein
MLTPHEKAQLENRKILEPKKRANLYYRIAQKTKKHLSELDDINFALRSIPPKNAKNILNDKTVESIFLLTERILEILGYAPIITDNRPIKGKYVLRSEEKLSEDRTSKEFKIRIEAPRPEDDVRQHILKDHIERLEAFTNPQTLVAGFVSLEEIFEAQKLYDEINQLRRDQAK